VRKSSHCFIFRSLKQPKVLIEIQCNICDKMPGERYDYKEFIREIESRFQDRLEKGEHIIITEDESIEFFGRSIEDAKTGHCILENNEDPKELKRKGHATIVCQLGQKDYSSRITIKNGRRVLEVWKPPSKIVKERKLDKKYHLLGASHFFESHAKEIENMIENNDYWYSSWNYSIAAEKKKYLSAPFQLYVGYESKVKAYFRVVDFWTDIKEDKDLGEVLHDENWREHFLDDQSTINSTHWDEIHKEKWKTRTIFKCDKIEIFPREKDLNEFESMEGYQPRLYQKGFDIIVGEKRKRDSMKSIGIVAKIAWSHNEWGGFDNEGYKKRRQYNYSFVKLSGYAHEWWNFYEKFNEKYYCGHVEVGDKKPQKKFKDGLILIISYNINDRKVYLVGFYGNAEFSDPEFNTGKKMIELFSDDYIKNLKQTINIIKQKGDIRGANFLEEVFSGKRNYEANIVGVKELSTLFDDEAYIEIDPIKDLNIKRFGQAPYFYIGYNETVPSENIYKLLLRAKEKHDEILKNVQDIQRKEEIRGIIGKIDLSLDKYFSGIGETVGPVNYYIETSKSPWPKQTGKILVTIADNKWRIMQELKPGDIIIHYRSGRAKQYPQLYVGYSTVNRHAKTLTRNELLRLLKDRDIWDEEYNEFAKWIGDSDEFWIVELEDFIEFEDDKKPSYKTVKEKLRFEIIEGYLHQLDEKIAKSIIELTRSSETNYFWLTANPKIWQVKELKKGETVFYTAYNKKGNKRRIFSAFEKAKLGDKVIFYEATPVKNIVALGEITEGLHKESQEGFNQSVDGIRIKYLEDIGPIPWPTLIEIEELENSSPIRNGAQGSLFELKEKEYENILALEGPEEEEKIRWEDIKQDLGYDTGSNFEIDETRLFFPEKEKETLEKQIATATRNSKHIILIGPPGTGKSKLAKEICEFYVGKENYIMSTATSDWSTFDTIGGYHPDKEGGLYFKSGIFLRCFKDSKNLKSRNRWLIIDEINRADIDKAFGSLFSALTGDNITLPFEFADGQIEVIGKPEDEIEVQGNLFIIHPDWRIIATMNTLDKASLYEMSYAFMRRFAFIPVNVPNEINEKLIQNYLDIWGSKTERDSELVNELTNLWKTINKFRKIGPAIIKDIYEYLSKERDLISAVIMFVLPQFEGLAEEEILKFVKELDIERKDGLKDFCVDFFGIKREKFEETE